MREYNMTVPSLESFFSGGGGKSWSWKDLPLGSFISGVVKSVGAPEQATDPATKLPAVTRQGKPRIQVRVTLQTTLRDPTDPEDDGTRNLYVGGWMTGAIGDAMAKAGVQNVPPQVGSTLTVYLSEKEENGPGVNPTNKFVAQYVPGAPVATQQFFAGGQPPAGVAQPPAQQFVPPPAVQQPVPQQQAFIPPVAQPVAQQQFVPPMAVHQPAMQAPPAGPVRPEAIAQAAWDAMDPGTKVAVAATMGGNSPGAPPF